MTAENIAGWTQAIRDVPTQSPYWKAYPPRCTSKHVQFPTDWRQVYLHDRVAVDDYVEEDEEAFDEYKDIGLFDENNEGLLVPDESGDSEDGEGVQAVGDKKAVGPTPSPANRVDHLLRFTKHIPMEEQEDYQRAIRELGALAGIHASATAEAHSVPSPTTTSPPIVPQPGNRRVIFENVIRQLIEVYREDSYFRVQDLVDMPVEKLKMLNPDIQEGFSWEEVLEICKELSEQDNLT